MKKYIFAILLFNTYTSLCQPWYSKIIDPFDGKQEKSTDLFLVGDTIMIRALGACGDKLCTTLGKYSTESDELYQAKYLDMVEGGFSIMSGNVGFILSSEDKIQNDLIHVSVIDHLALNHINTIDLKIPNNKYFNYTIKKSIEYNNKFWVGCQAQDKETFINYPGWYNYQENAVFFVLDKNLQTDTILIQPPSSGAHLKIEDLAVGADSILYISFFEKYLNTSTPNPYLEIRKVVYGFDQNYQRVFQWTGPNLDIQESLACLVVGPDSTIYLNHKRNYRSYLMAMKPNGTVQWECLLDSTIGSNLYHIKRLILADNGDIIGTGIISSAFDELGESGFLFRVTPDGNLKWKKAIRVNKGFDLTVPLIYPYETGLEDLTELPNGDLLAVGYVRRYVGNTLPDGPYNFDIWILRTSSEGCLWEDCAYIQDIVTKSTYLPVVTPANEWIVDHIPPPAFPAEIRRYTFAADSVLLDGKYYRELIFSRNMSGGPWISAEAFLREESGRTYKWVENMLEHLIYDFNFGVGDSLPGTDMNQATRHVTQVGSVQLLDNVPRKSIEFNSSCGVSKWVEGIGEIEDLLYSEVFCSLWDGVPLNIRCFSTNGQLIYLRPDLSGCYTVATQEAYLSNIKTFPNPASERLFFETEQDESLSNIQIFNSLGVIALNIQPLPSSPQGIDIASLPAGFYTGFAFLADGKTRSFKFVIAR